MLGILSLCLGNYSVRCLYNHISARRDADIEKPAGLGFLSSSLNAVHLESHVVDI